MENHYAHGGSGGFPVTQAEVDALIASLECDQWGGEIKSEAAYCAAGLVRAGNFELGLRIANAVAKAMGRSMGGGMHGTCEALAYMHMVSELNKAGVVAGAKGTKVKVNGKQVSVKDAMEDSEIITVEAVDSPVAVRIARLSRIRFDDMRTSVQMSVKMSDDEIKAGTPVTMTVKVKNPQNGDVLCVALPECLSRIVSGAKTKKFQVDFAGKDTVKIDLVSHAQTKKPQRWAAVVRNMYDGTRLGSVGLMMAEVKKGTA